MQPIVYQAIPEKFIKVDKLQTIRLKAQRELKFSASEGRLFQMFTTRSVKNVDLGCCYVV